uniref:Uncharacterized protein n=1 Tax=Avena sativa TaxID=4498 RepID=A0ACD5XGZ7_AVESA
MVSPYYEVFEIPTLGDYLRGEVVTLDSMEESEWPPSLCKMYVFSSKSGCWEEKDFLREGDAAGTVGEVRAGYSEFTAAYFRGALYVHCKTDFLMRVSLSDNTYRVIKPPMGLKVDGHEDIIVARSEKGVYFVAFDGCWSSEKWCLRVWILNESCGQMEWSLKHEKDLKHMLPRQCFRGRVKWILEDINYKLFRVSSSTEVNNRATTEEKFEWNSDGDAEGKDMVDRVENKLELNSNNDSALNYGGAVEDHYGDESRYDRFCLRDIELLGIHPYKEIVFLSASRQTCLAYHLNDSKIEELGKIYPKEYESFKMLVNEMEIIRSFPYTPCWIEEFPGNN